jgi:hypothetical protein
MQPTPQDVHVDAILTNLSIAYRNRNYIADEVFPGVGVKKQSDKYFVFPRGAWHRDEAQIRAPGGEAPEGGYELSDESYFANEWAFKHGVPIEVIDNADDPLQPWRTGVNFVTDKILLRKERLVAGAVLTPGNWTFGGDRHGYWAHDAATNTFYTDMLDAIEDGRKRGINYNGLLLEGKTFKEIKQISEIVERIKYTGTSGKPADVTPDTLAALFELEKVVIGRAIYSTAKEKKGATDFTPADIWDLPAGKGMAFLYYVPPQSALETPSAGYSFNWRRDELGLNQIISQEQNNKNARLVEKWWEKARKRWVVQGSDRFDIKVISADCGCLFQDTIQD